MGTQNSNGWFQLDPQNVVERVRAGGRPAQISGLRKSLLHGAVGFTILSIAGFVPWAAFGRWFYRTIGEAGLYAVCALVFIGLSGPLLHRLIIGRGSLSRFYKLFGLVFTANSILWIAGWMTFRGHVGSIVGLLLGTSAMGWLLTRAFNARDATLKVIAAIFLLNSFGYFVGGWVEGIGIGMKLPDGIMGKSTQVMLAQLLWGVCYGLGFGAGIGLAFHFCQRQPQNPSPRLDDTQEHDAPYRESSHTDVGFRQDQRTPTTTETEQISCTARVSSV